MRITCGNLCRYLAGAESRGQADWTAEIPKGHHVVMIDNELVGGSRSVATEGARTAATERRPPLGGLVECWVRKRPQGVVVRGRCTMEFSVLIVCDISR